MSVTSAAEANLDAMIRPAVSAMRSRTSYPRRSNTGTQLAAVAPAASAVETVGSAAVRPSPIRLTRRGRTVLGMLTAGAVLVMTGLIWLAIVGHAQAASQVKAGVPAASSVRRIVVEPGETLWGIAVKFDPSVDPRVVIPEIVDLNLLSGTSIQVGQVLLVPRD
jgi:LysM repeat protein